MTYKFLRASVKVFKVLAWVALGLQVITGVILVFGGGERVLVAGVDIPARVVGLLNFIAGGVYYFSLRLTAELIQLLLDIRDHQGGGKP